MYKKILIYAIIVIFALGIFSFAIIKKSNNKTDEEKLNSKIDEEIKYMSNFVVGANVEGYHYINCNLKDINYDICADIVNVKEEDICPVCGGRLYFKKGIEIGNTFKLGTKYAEKLGLTYLDENNESKPVVMGCYGIGPGRILASVIEQNNDEKGIVFPLAVAPYKVAIAALNTNDEECMNYSNKLYEELNKLGIDTILDDREERPGVKFNDLELIGIPIRITVGRKLTDGLVEFKVRSNDEVIELKTGEVIDYIKDYINKNI